MARTVGFTVLCFILTFCALDLPAPADLVELLLPPLPRCDSSVAMAAGGCAAFMLLDAD
jgi:hypothetical protein